LIIQVVCCSVDHDGLSVDPGDVVADPAMLIAGLILEMLLLTQPCLLLVHVISRTIDHYTLSWFKKHPFVEKIYRIL